MSDRLEQLLREAQLRRAAEAPDPDRVRRALPARLVRQARRRRIGMAGGAVLAAVAVLAALVFAPHGGGAVSKLPADVPSSPSSSPSPAAVRSAQPDVTRSHVPGWLPAGFHERRRQVVRNSTGVFTLRTWAKAPLGPSGQLLDSVPFIRVTSMPAPQVTGGTPVDVGGVQGWYSGPFGDNPAVSLAWPDGTGGQLKIETNSVTAQADLLHVATSVRPDPTPLPQPLVVRWTPFEPRSTMYEYGGAGPADWDADLTVSDPDQPAAALRVRLGRTTDVPEGGTAVQVGGRPGRLVVEEGADGTAPRQCVAAEQPGGLWLSVCNYVAGGPGGVRMPEDQLLRAADSVDPTMRADTGWLG
ncbi:hypothetical protein [Dactylosporangium sp. NPDC048998]|uniref:hypothetical protein n=1 Tax=Dactylosporangium sp. NPDC048998 TaxID=3363976 RepID=UPI00371C6FB8